MDEFLINLMICPVTKSKLFLSKDKSSLVSSVGKESYKIKDGVIYFNLKETK